MCAAVLSRELTRICSLLLEFEYHSTRLHHVLYVLYRRIGVPYSMYVPVDISNFGTSTKSSSKPRKWIGFILKLFYTTLSCVVRSICVSKDLSWESYDQRRSRYLSPETQDAITIVSFSQPLVPIVVNWKMANIAAVAGSFDS